MDLATIIAGLSGLLTLLLGIFTVIVTRKRDRDSAHSDIIKRYEEQTLVFQAALKECQEHSARLEARVNTMAWEIDYLRRLIHPSRLPDVPPTPGQGHPRPPGL